MKQPTNSRLSLFIGLLSSAVSSATAACSGAGQDGLVTVGIRPTVVVAADGGIVAGDAGGLPTPGSDLMSSTPDGNSSTMRAAAVGGASAASAGSAARVGTETIIGRNGTTTPPPAGVAGAGGAGSGAAGAGGARSSVGPVGSNAGEDECGAIPAQPAGNVTSARMGGSGLVEYDVNTPNVFTGLRTTLAVPAEPPPNGQIYIWPGLQPTPNETSFQPIGNGALMSVLAWGSACGTNAPDSYSTWWVASTYSNISSSDPQYSGCHVGKAARAAPKQLLDVDIHLEGTTWIQKVVNRDTMETSELRMDLKGQEQGRVFFDIELPTTNKPTEDIIFTNTVLSMDMSDPGACQPVLRGMNDFASKPRVSADGKRCCIDRIVLRAPRVMATTTDPP